MVKVYRKRKGFSLIELTIVFGIIFVLAEMAIPPFRRGGENRRQRACFMNQRLFLSAIEMYDMDYKNTLHELNDEVIEMLIKGKYLNGKSSDFVCPETDYKGKYLSLGNISRSGVIYCTYHGTLDGMKIEPDMTFADYLDERAKITRKDIQKALENEQHKLARQYSLIGLILSFICSLIYEIKKRLPK